MGYTTDFEGRVTIEPPLNPHEVAYLRHFNQTRRMRRHNGPYYLGTGFHGQDHQPDIIDYNSPDPTQPGLWCNWTPTDDGTGIEWDGGEKFYNSVEWMQYLINTFLRPGADLQRELAKPNIGRCYPTEFAHFTFDHIVNGRIEAQGEDGDDVWALVVDDNRAARAEAGREPATTATTYLVVTQQLYGHPDDHQTVYGTPPVPTFTTRDQANRAGTAHLGHDDFNIATLIDGRLAAFGHGDGDFTPAEFPDLVEVAEQLGLELHDPHRAAFLAALDAFGQACEKYGAIPASATKYDEHGKAVDAAFMAVVDAYDQAQQAGKD